MKRLLLSCTYYTPNISGVSIYVKLLAEAMSKYYEVTVLSSQFLKAYPKEETINNVKIIRSSVLTTIGKGVIMPFFIIDAYKEIKRSEVINCHLPQIESVILAILAKIFKKKLVVTHHCEFGFDGVLSNKIVAVLSFIPHLITYLLADKIVAYTKDYADHSIFLKLFVKKVEFILPPVVVGKEDGNDMLKIRNIIGEGKVIGYVGRIGWEKGLKFLIEAFQILKKSYKAKLVLVGPYENVAGDMSFQKLKPFIDLDKDIVLYGPMGHDKLVNFYKICECLVLPSTNNLETFGIVQAEAMICGCPVVASDLPGVRVPVGLTSMGEIAKVKDSNDLAEKIIKVLENSYSKKQIIEAQKLFSISLFVKSYERLFD